MEVWAVIALAAAWYGAGYWWGARRTRDKLMGVHTGAPGSKCRVCGTLVEGGGLDMEAHTRFYCRPPQGGTR